MTSIISNLFARKDISLTGRALVTGGTSGIGLAFSRALAARGLDLVLIARNEERLASTAAELHDHYGIEVETASIDISDDDGIDQVAKRLASNDSPIDVFINNAGHGLHTPLLSDDLDTHRRGLAVMVRAVLELGGAAGRAMKGRGYGVIVNVGSVAGTLPLGAYSAIKAYVNTYSEGLALELENHGVTVTGLMPGWVRTEFHERAKIRASSIPTFLWLDADRVVNDCLNDVERGAIRSIPSLRFKTIVTVLENAPRPLARAAARVVKGARR